MSETRALNAALSGPVFHGAASRSALHASERHVERWAPEGPAATRSGGLRSLGFADRIAAPWMNAAMQSRGARMMAQPTTDRSTPNVSWLFPRPWFQDEIDWMAAARVGAEQTPQFLTTRGTYETARTSPSDVAMPMVSPSMVAPSMTSYGLSAGMAPEMSADLGGVTPGGPGGPGGERYGQVQHGLRAYSPMVPFAAAAAAEVVAGTIGLAHQSGLTAVAGSAGRSPVLGALTMVAPASLAAPAIAPARSLMPSAAAPAMTVVAPSAPATSPAPTSSATRAMIDAARASVTRVEEARHAPAPTAEAAPSTAAASAIAPVSLVAPGSGVSGVSGDAPVSSPIESASASERSIVDATSSSSAIAHAWRSVDLLLQSASPDSATATPGASPAFAPTAHGLDPIVGPRVSMPAGLGGLITALDAQRATTRPMARFAGPVSSSPLAMTAAPFAPTVPGFEPAATRAAGAPSMPVLAASRADAPAREVPGFAPVWTAPVSALGAIAADRSRAVDHMAWSDRWLARFVGASPVALAALDVASEHSATVPGFGAAGAAGVGGVAGVGTAAPRTRDVMSPEAVYLRPLLPASTLAAAIRASSTAQPIEAPRAAPPRPHLTPERTLRIDDNESVSDDIFAAIAAAAVAPPRPVARPAAAAAAADQPVVERPAQELRSLTPADVVRAGARPTIADLVSIAPPPAPGAGLSPGLASSPMAPAMAGMLPLPSAPVFDTRALYPEALSSAYLGGLLSRSAAPVGVLSSTPTTAALIGAGGMAAFAANMAATAEASTAAGAPAMTLPMGFAALRDARTWAGGDQSVAPASLRLADAAPERVVLAADEARRATRTPFTPSEIAAGATSMATPFFTPSAVAAGAPSVLADLASSDGPAGAPSVLADTAPESRIADEVTQPPAVAAAETPVAPAASYEPELVGLRAALLTAPGATSLPLAFAEFLPMLSGPAVTPSAAPGDVTASPAITSLTSAGAPGAAPAPGTPASFANRGLTLPAVGGASAHGASIDDSMPIGAAGTAGAAAFGASAFGAFGGAGPFVAMQAPVAATSTGRPGSLAEMILAWSVAEERAATDLSFDFVAPEMVLAAKVYGLSPAAAVQAARLAVAGPGAMASLATSVDLTFLRGFQQVQAQQAQQAQRASFADAAAPSAPSAPSPWTTADGSAAPTIGATGVPFVDGVAPGAHGAAAASASATAASASAASFAADGDISPQTFGGAMPSVAGSVLSSPRLPRGAFLWPEAAVAALGLRALSPDGIAGMPVVALELLAAAAVADLGTWVTAFPSADQGTIANVIRGLGGTVPTSSTASGPMSLAASLAASPAASPSATSLSISSPAAPGTAPFAGAPLAGAGDDLAAEVPDLPGAPTDLRTRFEAIYIALARTGEGQTLSPSARAARAMSLLARSDGGSSSARERALAAWSMLPQVYQGDLDVVAPASHAGANAEALAEGRPGLAGLAARAGESLGSFVSPSAGELRGASRDSSVADRAGSPVYVNTASTPTAAQVETVARAMSRPGRAFAQTGGGEPEIPSWFEEAARRVLSDRGPGASGGMSLADLVLVTSAATPAKSIAAATRGASSTPAQSSPMVSGGHAAGEKPNVEKLAIDVYQEVLRLIDITRERSGDPYQ